MLDNNSDNNSLVVQLILRRAVMSLFQCPKCGANISSEAAKCPHCGLESPWTVKCEAEKIANSRIAQISNDNSASSNPQSQQSSRPNPEVNTVYVVKEEKSTAQSVGQSMMSCGVVLTIFVTIPFLLLIFAGL